MSAPSLVDFFSGAVTFGYIVASFFFVTFWQRTHDRLFINFAVAFALLAVNQVFVFALGYADDRGGYAYVLRVLAFMLILLAIADKNASRRRGPK